MENCPILPVSAVDVPGIIYTDLDSPSGDFVTQVQQRLVDLGGYDLNGLPLQVTGNYGPETARTLAHWMAEDPSRWPSADLVHVMWGHWVADCRTWNALGLDCQSVQPVADVTPYADKVAEAVRNGVIGLSCDGSGGSEPAPPPTDGEEEEPPEDDGSPEPEEPKAGGTSKLFVAGLTTAGILAVVIIPSLFGTEG